MIWYVRQSQLSTKAHANYRFVVLNELVLKLELLHYETHNLECDTRPTTILFIGNESVNAPARSHPRLRGRSHANAHNGIVEARLERLSLGNVECLNRITQTAFGADVKSGSTSDAISSAFR